MRNLILAFAALATLGLLLVIGVYAGRSRAAAAAASIAPSSVNERSVRPESEAQRMQTLEDRLASLSMEVRRLSGELARMATERVPAGELHLTSDGPPAEGSGVTPEWFLEQYVLSFRDGGEGSEYFRLAVDAYSAVLLDEITQLVLDGGAHLVLRVRLVEMLGNPRFRGVGQALDVLLRVLRVASDEPRLVAALNALSQIGDEGIVSALEGSVWSLPTTSLQQQALALIIGLSGRRANEAIVRLLLSAPDSAARAFLVTLIQPGDVASVLAAFRVASTLEQPVRLQAAESIGEFHDEAMLAFVDEWIAFETDEEVRAVLTASREEITKIPSWHAMQATGPPDAEPSRDDPKAWTTQSPDMGTQWLELTYDVPRTAYAVRVFEVNVPGAISRVVGVEPSGAQHTLWSGVDPTQTPGVFEIEFPTTSFLVERIILSLDTNRGSGWNEIDAVELVGPHGAGWASSAKASSTYGE